MRVYVFCFFWLVAWTQMSKASETAQTLFSLCNNIHTMYEHMPPLSTSYSTDIKSTCAMVCNVREREKKKIVVKAVMFPQAQL